MASLCLTVSFCPQDYVDAPLSIPDFLTCSLNIDWSQYQVRGPLVPNPQAPQAEVWRPGSPPTSDSLGKEELLVSLTLSPDLLLAQKIKAF